MARYNVNKYNDEEITKLYNEGVSISDIAKRYGIKPKTLYGHLVKIGVHKSHKKDNDSDISDKDEEVAKTSGEVNIEQTDLKVSPEVLECFKQLEFIIDGDSAFKSKTKNKSSESKRSSSKNKGDKKPRTYTRSEKIAYCNKNSI